MQNKITEQAATLGCEHGKAAAGWVFDARTSDRTYQTVLRGITDGDPEIMDAFRAPGLSGEFAGDYTETALLEDLGLPDLARCQDDEILAWVDEPARTYNDAASQGFWDQIERRCREHVGERKEASG